MINKILKNRIIVVVDKNFSKDKIDKYKKFFLEEFLKECNAMNIDDLKEIEKNIDDDIGYSMYMIFTNENQKVYNNENSIKLYLERVKYIDNTKRRVTNYPDSRYENSTWNLVALSYKINNDNTCSINYDNSPILSIIDIQEDTEGFLNHKDFSEYVPIECISDPYKETIKRLEKEAIRSNSGIKEINNYGEYRPISSPYIEPNEYRKLRYKKGDSDLTDENRKFIQTFIENNLSYKGMNFFYSRLNRDPYEYTKEVLKNLDNDNSNNIKTPTKRDTLQDGDYTLSIVSGGTKLANDIITRSVIGIKRNNLDAPDISIANISIKDSGTTSSNPVLKPSNNKDYIFEVSIDSSDPQKIDGGSSVISLTGSSVTINITRNNPVE